MMTIDMLIEHAAQVVTCASSAPKRRAAMQDVGLISDGAVAISDGKIIAVGATRELQAAYAPRQRIDASGKVVMPGFVDPHTHLVYGGDRVNEFELRIKGATYMEIMAAGGGIVSTMRATRSASALQLAAQTQKRLKAMVQSGVTTMEIKSGYGLSIASELTMLQAIEELENAGQIDCIPTFLGAHALPPEYKDRGDEYVDLIVNEMLPQVAEWYRQSIFAKRGKPFFNDVFCEKNAFSLAQSRRVLEAGNTLNMRPKIHADEFTSLGGVSLAVELDAISADHLDVTTPEERKLLAESNTIAVILPPVNFNFGSSQFANARAMIDEGVAVALSTDINPGSAPCVSLQFVMALACRYQKLLPSEALNACTINAAYAIGMEKVVGSLEPGKQADVLIVDAPDYRHLAYQFGGNLVELVIKRGCI